MRKTKKIKTGDRIKHISGSPVMKIANYVNEKIVECVCKRNGEVLTGFYNQKDLVKTKRPRLRNRD